MRIDMRAVRNLLGKHNDNWSDRRQDDFVIFYQGKHYFIRQAEGGAGYIVRYYFAQLGSGNQDWAPTFDVVIKIIKDDPKFGEPDGYAEGNPP